MNILRRISRKIGILKIPFLLKIYLKIVQIWYKLPDSDDVIVNLDNNVKLNIYNPNSGLGSRELYLTGSFEKKVKEFFKQNIIKNMNMLDVGADMGYYTVLFADLVGKGGKIYAFEPIPKANEKLIKNIKLNNFENVIVCDFALSDRNGSTILVKPGTESRISMDPSKEKNKNDTIDVLMKTFDDYAAESKINKIDFIKIDVEGAEMNVLKGMKKSITKFHPEFLIEVHSKKLQLFDYNEESVFEFFKDLSYEFKLINVEYEAKHYHFYHNSTK